MILPLVLLSFSTICPVLFLQGVNAGHAGSVPIPIHKQINHLASDSPCDETMRYNDNIENDLDNLDNFDSVLFRNTPKKSFFCSSNWNSNNNSPESLDSNFINERDSFYSSSSPIFKAIIDSGYFDDSKDYVDSPSTADYNTLISVWKNIDISNPASIYNFIATYFPKKGAELISADIQDWSKYPFFIRKARPDIKPIANSLNELWKEFGKETIDIKCSECISTFLTMKNPFIVPGGRFREIYYWDTYFILQGLFSSEMFDTAKGIIQNFIDFVEDFGFIPNGSRSYYLNRSQPPLLIQMVRLYLENTDDKIQVLQWLPTLEKEIGFWINNRSIEVDFNDDTYHLFRYDVDNSLPRPEAYIRDEEVGMGVPLKDREQLYRDMASGAESGWDFSTRWTRLDNLENVRSFDELLQNITYNENVNIQEAEFEHLRKIRTSEIVPVDLNAIMYANFDTLSKFYRMRGDKLLSHDYEKRAGYMKKAIDNMFWDSRENSFMDFNITSNQISPHWSLAGYFVHWFNATDLPESYLAYDKILDLSERFEGGIPTSVTYSGLQWDFPNVWPPLQYALIKGIDNFGKAFNNKQDNYIVKRINSLLLKTRSNIINRYVTTTYCGWYKSKLESGKGLFYEKYDSRYIGKPGGGGEYGLVTGFGWTNGVLQWILDEHQSEIKHLHKDLCSN